MTFGGRMEKVHDTASGFLPDDYVKQRAERRTNIAAVVLFAVERKRAEGRAPMRS